MANIRNVSPRPEQSGATRVDNPDEAVIAPLRYYLPETTDSKTRDRSDIPRTLQQLGIIVGIPVWAFLRFWPMIGHDFTAYSGINYVLQSEDTVANFFFTGLFVGFVVVVSAYDVVRR